MRWMKPALLCLIAPLLLTACVGQASEPPLPRIVTVRRPVCPPLKIYQADAQRRAADTLQNLPRDDPLGDMIVDYGQLRAALRAACKGN